MLSQKCFFDLRTCLSADRSLLMTDFFQKSVKGDLLLLTTGGIISVSF
jgi:hypothetical protein